MDTMHTVQLASIIRAELKSTFPEATFSVRKGSGGGSVDVTWTDGPTTKEVDTSLNRFRGRSFDGMTDSNEYRPISYNGTQYSTYAFVSCQRATSAELMQRAAKVVAKKWGCALPTITVDRYGGHIASNDDFRVENANEWASHLVYQETFQMRG